MLRHIVNAIGMLIVLTLLTGIIYPLAMTGLAQVLFPFQANGSLIVQGGTPVGSQLIGQAFSSPGYFHGRPSATGQNGYDATSSGGSNLGPTSKKLMAAVTDNLSKIREENGLGTSTGVPSDLVLASGSGLDPHISPDAAYLQVGRVARERGLEPGAIRSLVDGSVEGRQWGIFGESRVNVLKLNLALDVLKK